MIFFVLLHLFRFFFLIRRFHSIFRFIVRSSAFHFTSKLHLFRFSSSLSSIIFDLFRFRIPSAASSVFILPFIFLFLIPSALCQPPPPPFPFLPPLIPPPPLHSSASSFDCSRIPSSFCCAARVRQACPQLCLAPQAAPCIAPFTQPFPKGPFNPSQSTGGHFGIHLNPGPDPGFRRAEPHFIGGGGIPPSSTNAGQTHPHRHHNGPDQTMLPSPTDQNPSSLGQGPTTTFVRPPPPPPPFGLILPPPDTPEARGTPVPLLEEAEVEESAGSGLDYDGSGGTGEQLPLGPPSPPPPFPPPELTPTTTSFPTLLPPTPPPPVDLESSIDGAHSSGKGEGWGLVDGTASAKNAVGGRGRGGKTSPLKPPDELEEFGKLEIDGSASGPSGNGGSDPDPEVAQQRRGDLPLPIMGAGDKVELHRMNGSAAPDYEKELNGLVDRALQSIATQIKRRPGLLSNGSITTMTGPSSSSSTAHPLISSSSVISSTTPAHPITSTDQCGVGPAFVPCVPLSEANARLLACCQQKQLPPGCHPLCRYDTTQAQVKQVFEKGQCGLLNISPFLQCAAQGQNNVECCRHRQIAKSSGAQCEVFCNPAGGFGLLGIQHLVCQSVIQTMLECHHAGLH